MHHIYLSTIARYFLWCHYIKFLLRAITISSIILLLATLTKFIVILWVILPLISLFAILLLIKIVTSAASYEQNDEYGNDDNHNCSTWQTTRASISIPA